MMILNQKNILLGVTGSISAYKACDLVQRLKDQGATVKVVMTPSATKIITPLTFTALTGSQVSTEIFNSQSETAMEHIELARWADLFIIAPCTANTLGELAHGLTGSLVSTLYLAFEKRVYIAPAMNSVMLKAPAVQRNLTALKNKGDVIFPSGKGMLACGEYGEGKLLDVEALVEYLKAGESLSGDYPNLVGKKCLIALGHTQEKIDDIRFIANRSSGKTGLAIARCLKLAGAEVHLVIGPSSLPTPAEFVGDSQVTRVESTEDYHKAIIALQPNQDTLILAAALSDFTPTQTFEGKQTGSKTLKNIDLKPSVNILENVLQQKQPHQVVVAFALENPGQESRGLEKWEKHGSDILFLNTPLSPDEAAGFDHDNVRGVILSQRKKELPQNLPLVSKFSLADNLLAELSPLFD